MTAQSAKPSRRVLRALIRGAVFTVSAVLVGSLAAWATYGLSVQPGAAIVKAVFELKPE